MQLTQNDLALAVYDSADGTSWNALPASTLAGFFGPHRCLCPDTISVAVQLTASGQTNLGNSTIAVNFLLGASCATSPASCTSLGQASFSSNQTAEAPHFSSTQVFQSAAGSATVNCASLTAGSTTVWAILAQDGVALPFALSIELPVIAATVGAPTAVTAQPGNQGILVTWTPPANMTLVAGYQVLCLPRPATASTAGYESCRPDQQHGRHGHHRGRPDRAVFGRPFRLDHLDPAHRAREWHLLHRRRDRHRPEWRCQARFPRRPRQRRSQPRDFSRSTSKTAERRAACSLAPARPTGRAELLWLAAAVAVAFGPMRYLRRRRRRKTDVVTRVLALLFLFGATAQAQEQAQEIDSRHSDDWAVEAKAPRLSAQPDWGFELGVSLYRPAVDSELGNGAHPYADTFSNSRHLMSEAELDRYLGHRFGTWGVGLRAGYYKVTGSAFLADGVTRSGDETALRLIPFSLSLLYKADGLAGLKNVPLFPYVKAGLDGAMWTATTTGTASRSGFSPGWHVAAGVSLGLNFLVGMAIVPGALADPCAIFFEWDYAAINGLGLGNALHVGDNTWFAGIMFDL